MDAVTTDLDVDAIIAVDVTAVAGVGVAMAFLLSEMVPAAVFSGSLFFCVPAETTASDATTDAEPAIPAGSSLSSCFSAADAAIAADANSICSVKRRQRQPLCLFFYSKWNPPLLKSPAGQDPAGLERQMSPKGPNPGGKSCRQDSFLPAVFGKIWFLSFFNSLSFLFLFFSFLSHYAFQVYLIDGIIFFHYHGFLFLIFHVHPSPIEYVKQPASVIL